MCRAVSSTLISYSKHATFGNCWLQIRDLMALKGAGSSRNSAAANNPAHQKRPWTASEDKILVRYLKYHGEGNWNSVHLNSGLDRSAKSCRLRWANHLNPILKKGPISIDEGRRIIKLHEQLGGKWSLIAAELPGRTDNDVKNYWNIRYKRHKRTGLPMAPHQSHQDVAPPNYSLQQSSFQHSNNDLSCSLNLIHSPVPNTLAMSSIGICDYKVDALVTKSWVEKHSSLDLGAVRDGGFIGCGTSVNDYIRNAAPVEKNYFMDEELSYLLNSFPLSVPIPDWEDCGPCLDVSPSTKSATSFE